MDERFDCERCLDSGWWLDGKGHARPCDCGAAQRALAERFIRESRIPKALHRCDFDNWDVSTPERLALRDAASTYVREFKPCYRGATFYGPTGCGKTHLAVAILRGVAARGFSVRFANAPEMLAEVRASWRDDSERSEFQIIEDLTEADLLVLDDLGAEKLTDRAVETLYLIFNRRSQDGRATIVTTNVARQEAATKLGERTASRLAGMCPSTGFVFPAEDWRRGKR